MQEDDIYFECLADLQAITDEETNYAKIQKEWEDDWDEALMGGEPETLQFSAQKDYSCIQGHLNSPITYEEISHLLTFENFYCGRHKKWKNFIRDKNVTLECNPWECLRVEILRTTNVQYDEHRLKRLIKVAFDNYSLQQSHMTRSVCREEIPDIPPKLHELYEHKLKSEKFKDLHFMKKISFNRLIKFGGLTFDSDLVYFMCERHSRENLCPTTILQGVLDILQSSFSLHLYWWLSDHFQKYCFPIFKRSSELYERLLNLSFSMGQEFFKVMKLWEPLVTGYAVMTEGDLGFHKLFQSCQREIDQILYPRANCVDLFLFINLLGQKGYIKFLLEISGMSKAFGHPTLNIQAGLEKVRTIAQQQVQINRDNIKDIIGMSMYMWGTFYLRKHGKYPYKDVPEQFPFINQIKRNEAVGFTELSSQPIRVWADLNFENVLNLDLDIDTIELIKDSAICTPLTDWAEDYDACAFRNLYGKKKPPKSGQTHEKRNILKYLTEDEHPVKRKVVELDEGYLNFERDGRAVLCPKERELSGPEGRPFLKQTFHQRLKQAFCEYMLAKQYLPYIPDQMMTISEIENLHRQQSAIRSLKSETTIICNIDFSKWNLRFRHEALKEFGEKLDQLFGTQRLFRDSHLWYEGVPVMSNHRMCPPDFCEDGSPLNGEYCHRGHLGGFEGMEQKKWTMWTQYSIRVVAFKMGLRVRIFGQGDNQVVEIKLASNQHHRRKEITEEFLEKLASFFKSVGHELKEEETWFSIKLFEFGKIRSFEGESVSNATKKACRLIPDVNDGVDCWASSLSTIATVTEAIARGDHLPQAAFVLNGVETLNFLIRKGILKDDDTINVLTMSLLIPNCVGGIMVSNLFSHSIRGHDDQLSYWLDLYKFMLLCPEFKTVAENVLEKIVLRPNKTRDLEILIMDVYALNITPLPSIDSTLKEHVKSFLKKNYSILNPEIRPSFGEDWEYEKTKLIDVLKDITPFFAPLAHEIFTNSRVGQILKLQNRLTHVQTINKIVEDEETDFLEIVTRNNQDFKKCFREKVLTKNPQRKRENLEILTTSECSFVTAKDLREKHWGQSIIGVTQPIPMCQTRMVPLDYLNQAFRSQSLIIQISNKLQMGERLSNLSIGPYPSYLGAKTRQKVTKPTTTAITRNMATSSVKKLMTLKSWLDIMGSQNLSLLLSTLIREHLGNKPIELEQLKEWTGTVWGGNMFHRFKCELQRNSAILNQLPTLGSHLKFCSDDMYVYSKQGKDYTIFFQLLFLYSQVYISFLCQSDSLIHPQYALAIVCPGCTQEISDFKLDLRAPPTYDEQSTLCLAQASEITFQLLNDSTVQTMRSLLSVHMGKLMSSEFNQVYFNTYQDSSESDEDFTNIICGGLSQADFRYMDLELILISIILHNRTIRSLLDSNISNYSIGVRGLITLSKFIYNENLIGLVILITGYKSEFHSEITKVSQLSSFLFKALKFWIMSSTRPLQRLLSIYYVHNVGEWKETYKLFRGKRPTDFQLEGIKDQYKLAKLNNLRGQITPIPITLDDPTLLWREKTKTENPSIFLMRTPITVLSPTISEVQFNINSVLEIKIKLDRYILISENDTIEIKDIHHIARPLGNISSSFSKFFFIFLLYRDKLSNDCMYFLAEGSGSMVAGTCHMTKNVMGYNTLLNDDIDNRTSAIDKYPPAINNDECGLRIRFPYQDILCQGQTDILDDDFVDKFTNLSKHTKIALLSIDAESKDFSSNNIIFAMKYYHIWKENSSKSSLLVIKMFFSVNIQIIESTVKEVMDEGYIVNFYKPLNSHLNNKEVYLCISNFHPRVPGLTRNELESIFSSQKNIIGISRTETYIKGLLSYSRTMIDVAESLNLAKCVTYKDALSYRMETTNSCGLSCINLFRSIKEEVDTLVRKMDERKLDPSMVLIGRLGGAKKQLKDLLLECLYIAFRRRYGDLSSFFLLYFSDEGDFFGKKDGSD
ncbi:MAG: RNA-dependent RNA polymerase [Hangzhou cletus punctiger xinmovirus 1]|uniref:RNA-directed RNA polymerase L n=1 Tax=Hangzhou cletus punctiger xinmovirus 1 TaxID=2905556 RepID=A0A8K1XCC7_9MONO|nr:MAG: RNA-dependent RNA polymerase [Hangzhou cletus punctiger xinmovirus 1]